MQTNLPKWYLDYAEEAGNKSYESFSKWQIDLLNVLTDLNDEKLKELFIKLEEYLQNISEDDEDKPTLKMNDVEWIIKELNEIEAKTKSGENSEEYETAIAGLKRKYNQLENKIERSIPETFGALIRHLRTKKGFSLRDLEKVTGVSSAYIHRIEKGERKSPSLRIVDKLAEALDIPRTELLDAAGMADEEGYVLSLEEMVLLKPFKINNKEVTKGQREALVKLLQKINSLEWTPETKTAEAISLIDYVNEYKESLR